MHCLIISVGYTFPPDYLWYRGSATADKVLKYYVIVLYFLYKMVFGMYIIARGGKSQLVLARPSCVFSGSSQIVISSWLGEPKRADLFYIKKVKSMHAKYFYLNFCDFIKILAHFSKFSIKNVGLFWLELNFLWLVLARAKYFCKPTLARLGLSQNF